MKRVSSARPESTGALKKSFGSSWPGAAAPTTLETPREHKTEEMDIAHRDGAARAARPSRSRFPLLRLQDMLLRL